MAGISQISRTRRAWPCRYTLKSQFHCSCKQGYSRLTFYSFAGSDTTAVAIRSIFYHLMKTPKAMARLVREIDEFDTRGEISRPHVTYSEAMKMPYLQACCKEGMRLHPSVGLGMPRHVPSEGATIAGRHFPGGSRVSMNAAVIHYDSDVFGEDAAAFNPERWLGSNAANMDRHMLHFGGGSRTCLGKNVSLVLSLLFRRG